MIKLSYLFIINDDSISHTSNYEQAFYSAILISIGLVAKNKLSL